MSSKFSILFRGQRETLRGEQKARLASCRGAIWIHAASVGEFEQARPLIEKLKDQRPQMKIVVTFFSPSGYEARKHFEMADGVFYLPFATIWNAKRFIETLQPLMAIFVKYEFWPAYLKALKKRNIPAYCISAIFRPTQRFFHWYGFSARRVLKCFTHIYVQDEASKQLLMSHGIESCSVAGDTRFDRVKEVMERSMTSHAERLAPVAQFATEGAPVLVAGSTWPEDEKLLAQFMDSCPQINGRPVKLILVPHEINKEHLHFIFNRFQGKYVTYSAVAAMPSDSSRLNILQQAKMLVIDQIGLLSSIYQFGHVAYVGGGFGVGIHNTIEAAVYGMPVLFGPNYHHFREAQGLIEAGGARSIKNYSEMEAALYTAFEQQQSLGAQAAEYVQSELGATEKIYKEIFNQDTRGLGY